MKAVMDMAKVADYQYWDTQRECVMSSLTVMLISRRPFALVSLLVKIAIYYFF